MIMLSIAASFAHFLPSEDRHVHQIEFYFTNHYYSSLSSKSLSLQFYIEKEHKTKRSESKKNGLIWSISIL